SFLDMKMAAIRHLPVVDANGKLVGIISARDVLLALGISSDRTVHLRDIMTREVEMVHQNDDAAEALGIMLDKKISALPVVGSKGQLVGVVTETDFLHVAHGLLTSTSESSDSDESDEADESERGERWSRDLS